MPTNCCKQPQQLALLNKEMKVYITISQMVTQLPFLVNR